MNIENEKAQGTDEWDLTPEELDEYNKSVEYFTRKIIEV